MAKRELSNPYKDPFPFMPGEEERLGLDTAIWGRRPDLMLADELAQATATIGAYMAMTLLQNAIRTAYGDPAVGTDVLEAISKSLKAIDKVAEELRNA